MGPKRSGARGSVRNSAPGQRPAARLKRGGSPAATSRLQAAAKKNAERVAAHELRAARAVGKTLRTRLAQERAALTRFAKKDQRFAHFRTEWDGMLSPGGRADPAALKSQGGGETR